MYRNVCVLLYLIDWMVGLWQCSHLSLNCEEEDTIELA